MRLRLRKAATVATLATALALGTITTAGSAEAAPTSVTQSATALGVTSASEAAPRAGSYTGARTYNVGVYLWADCEVRGAYYRYYYASRGYRVYYTCIYVGGYPPVHRALLRVTLAY
ncbi:hypothetical protein ACIBG6_38530 [Streptomyces sp. NPDC050842]|uniref:hypothetical protein n=1 Tax=Streptomyces sp. NPDC050842 TaxID=3365636 RepID=UPI003787D201